MKIPETCDIFKRKSLFSRTGGVPAATALSMLISSSVILFCQKAFLSVSDASFESSVKNLLYFLPYFLRKKQLSVIISSFLSLKGGTLTGSVESEKYSRAVRFAGRCRLRLFRQKKSCQALCPRWK